MSEFRGEGNVGNGDVIQHNIEPQSSSCKILADQSRNLTRHVSEPFRKCLRITDHFTLSDELASIELRDYTLENFVDDGRQYALVIVFPKFTVNLG